MVVCPVGLCSQAVLRRIAEQNEVRKTKKKSSWRCSRRCTRVELGVVLVGHADDVHLEALVCVNGGGAFVRAPASWADVGQCSTRTWPWATHLRILCAWAAMQRVLAHDADSVAHLMAERES